MRKIPVIAIAGPSGSGKSTLSRRIEGAYVLEMDEYFKDYRRTDYYLSPEWDTPGAYEFPLLEAHGRALVEGKKQRMAHFNFGTGYREEGPEISLEGKSALVVEGLYGIQVKLPWTLKIFVDCSFIQMVERCLPRDQNERGRTDLKKILWMYDQSWRKYDKVLFPQKKEADLVFPGDWVDTHPEKIKVEELLKRAGK